jgi:uncharacterized membrane protein YfcA
VDLDAWKYLVLFVIGGVGAFFNTLASSGSAITLPIMIALGIPAPVANGTNRLGVLIGAASALQHFRRERVIEWRNGTILSIPAVVGAAAGAGIASVTSKSTLTWAITGAVFVALALLCLRPSRWLRPPEEIRPIRIGAFQLGLMLVVGVWSGFIVLDSATYFLFVLVLAVGYDVVRANAVKSLILFWTSALAIVVFAVRGDLDVIAGVPMALGSVVGAQVGARVAVSPRAGVWIYRLLVLVIGGEAVQLAIRMIHE